LITHKKFGTAEEMQTAATAVGFSAVLPVKGCPAARTTPVVARVPAARRSLRRVAESAMVAAEPAEVDYSSMSFS
jgi:hypothetical protein